MLVSYSNKKLNSCRMHVQIPAFSLSQMVERITHVETYKIEFQLVTVKAGSTLHSFPHRTSFYGVGLCHQGSVVLNTGLHKSELRTDCLCIMSPEVIRNWQNQSADYLATGVFFTEAFFLENQAPATILRRFSFFQGGALGILQLRPEEAIRIAQLQREIQRVLAGTSGHKAALIRAYISILLHEIADCYEYHQPSRISPIVQPNYLVDHFKELVGTHYLRTRSVAEYARLLHITAKHLSETVKAVTGKTAGEWLNDMLILEAKVQLRQTSLTVSQVADALRFCDASAFSKFFKRQVGSTPVAYRQQTQA